MQRRLTDEQEQQLLVEHEDGWTINEISVMFKISHRTVYRTLAKHGVQHRTHTRRKQYKRGRKDRVRELKPCGTNAAWIRHKRAGEYPCTPCITAHNADTKQYKEAADRRKAKRK